MALMSRAKFKRELAKKLQEIGYEKYPVISDLHFVKYVGNGFYNVLFITFHRFDKGAFTGDFFLSLYPSSLYEEGWKRRRNYSARVARYLSVAERKNLLNHTQNIVDRTAWDGWWYQDDENTIDNFIKAITYSEPRFLAVENIHQGVLENVRLRWHYNMEIRPIIELVYSQEIDNKEYQYLPATDPDKIGMSWFKAAELFIKEKQKDSDFKFSLKKDSVKFLASISYMVDKYERIYGSYNPILLDLNCDKYRDLFLLQ